MTQISALGRSLYDHFGTDGTDRTKMRTVVAPTRLWQIVLNHRLHDPLSAKNPIIGRALQALRADGFQDPYEITQEVVTFTENLLKRYQPRTELEAALVIFRSIVHPAFSFHFQGRCLAGFLDSEGGLEIKLSADAKTPLRRKKWALLPSDILKAPKDLRVALCEELSSLLIVALRAAGIKAKVKSRIDHSYVVALLDGQSFLLDPAMLRFKATSVKGDPDSRGIAQHYSNVSFFSFISRRFLKEFFGSERFVGRLGRLLSLKDLYQSVIQQLIDYYEEGLEYCDIAIEIDPAFPSGWANKGLFLLAQREYGRATDCFDECLSLCPNYSPAWFDRGVALLLMSRYSEAISCFKRARDLKKND